MPTLRVFIVGIVSHLRSAHRNHGISEYGDYRAVSGHEPGMELYQQCSEGDGQADVHLWPYAHRRVHWDRE